MEINIAGQRSADILGVNQQPVLPEHFSHGGVIAASSYAVLASTITNPISPTQASIERGRATYFDQCAVCHGDSGRGDGTVLGVGATSGSPEEGASWASGGLLELKPKAARH